MTKMRAEVISSGTIPHEASQSKYNTKYLYIRRQVLRAKAPQVPYSFSTASSNPQPQTLKPKSPLYGIHAAYKVLHATLQTGNLELQT